MSAQAAAGRVAPDSLRALVNGVEQPAGRAVCRDLRQRGVAVLGVDVRPGPLIDSRTRGETAARSEIAYVARLRDLAQEHRATLLVPTIVEELPALARAQADFARAGVAIYSPPEGSARTCGDRYRTVRRLGDLGIPIPLSCPACGPHTARELAGLFGLPVLARPVRPGGGGGSRLFAKLAELTAGLEDLRRQERRDLFLQEFVPGPAYEVSLFLDPRDCDPVRACVVLGRGKAFRGKLPVPERVSDPEVERLAIQACLLLALRGPVRVKARKRGDGAPVVLEIQPCVGNSTPHAREVLDALFHSWTRDLGGVCNASR